MNDQEYDAIWRRGFDAFSFGNSDVIADNPYPEENSDEYNVWIAGYDEAETLYFLESE